ncbi:MAG: TIGR04283 family arsenosugar biosynthesis glycosyltransferase [Syntrophobacterales bacterium]
MNVKKPSEKPLISIIIPTLNEAENLGTTLANAQKGKGVEIVVVDGGSSDGTDGLAKSFGVRLLVTGAGRANQANAGALVAKGTILLFLHADTRLPEGFDREIQRVLANPFTVAGAFKLAIEGAGMGLRIIEKLANFRARFLKMPYGDQAIFLKADLFRSLGGFPDMPIMEDLVLMQRLRKMGRIAIAPAAVITSARRWEKLGVLKTTLINQAVLVAYFLGSNPERLARWYRRSKLRD